MTEPGSKGNWRTKHGSSKSLQHAFEEPKRANQTLVGVTKQALEERRLAQAAAAVAEAVTRTSEAKGNFSETQMVEPPRRADSTRKGERNTGRMRSRSGEAAAEEEEPTEKENAPVRRRTPDVIKDKAAHIPAVTHTPPLPLLSHPLPLTA